MAAENLQPNPPAHGAASTRTGFPRLYLSRHGVYYWRERNRWRSLRTKDPREASIFAMERNLYLARQRQQQDRMSIVDPNYPKRPRPDPDDHQRFEIDLRRGIFKYALANGHYTALHENPVAGLFVLSKTERIKQADPYQPFTPDDLRALFKPSAFTAWADAPDLWFAPLTALFTGMRIGEATAIKVRDVILAENGGHYIQIPASKTLAGIRNVPVCDALIRLGFLRYVDEARAAGHERIYPRRKLINGAYAKRLGERLREQLTNLGILDPRKSFHSFRVSVATALGRPLARTRRRPTKSWATRTRATRTFRWATCASCPI